MTPRRVTIHLFPERVMSEWYKVLQPGDGAIDIGANVGKVTQIFARQVGETGCVIAVEPHAANVKKLREAVARYPWVQVIEAAVSDSETTRCLYQDAHEARHSLWRENLLKAQNDAEPLLVRTTTLDALAAQVPRLKAIKVDTQGAEMDVFRGGMATLRRTDITWHVEFWPEGLRHAGSSHHELIALFKEHGYQPDGRTWGRLVEELEPAKGHNAMDIVVKR